MAKKVGGAPSVGPKSLPGPFPYSTPAVSKSPSPFGKKYGKGKIKGGIGPVKIPGSH